MGDQGPIAIIVMSAITPQFPINRAGVPIHVLGYVGNRSTAYQAGRNGVPFLLGELAIDAHVYPLSWQIERMGRVSQLSVF